MNRYRRWRPLVFGAFGLLLFLILINLLVRVFVFNLFWIVPGLYLLFFLLLFALNVLFAQGILNDAVAQRTTGKRVFFVAPEVWGLATVMGGLVVVALYWVLHHSTLRRA